MTPADQSIFTPASSAATYSAEANMQQVSQLLGGVEDTIHRPVAVTPNATHAHETHLAQARLGVAASLYLALKAKHSPTAAHSLRVAVLSSAWFEALQVPEALRDDWEIAALLHDIGKIGVPDLTLMKPGKLTAEELCFIHGSRRMGVDILSACTTSRNVLDTVLHIGAWYNGKNEAHPLSGDALPVGSRLISILDAFDSMTTDSVYRRAMSRERALAELHAHAGTQFDPHLVLQFHQFLTVDHARYEMATSRRWLADLQPLAGNAYWNQKPETTGSVTAVQSAESFHKSFIQDMNDAVFYVDTSLKILHWNQAAERLTGITAEAMEQNLWSPALVGLRTAMRKFITEENCPVAQCLREQKPVVERLEIQHINGSETKIEAIFQPIITQTQGLIGAAAQLRDVSDKVSLEERVQALHKRATRDNLTGVMNRSEFDRVFDEYIAEHYSSNRPCSLVICDLDFFKKVNDNYGHPAGDAALKSFAQLLSKHCRSGDVVARFGGEEFLLLCADCNNATAAKRAEVIRQELSITPQAMIGNNCMTASFGVTELQNGDDASSMLARADRALLQAKDNGRNQVVQLGVGLTEKTTSNSSSMFGSIMRWFADDTPQNLIESDLATSVPLAISVEKLRGFVSDHQAEIVTIEAKQVVIQMDGDKIALSRRSTDRSVPFLIDLQFSEHVDTSESRTKGKTTTLMHVSIRPKRGRDRRMANVQERAKQIFASLKSYLVAKEVSVS
jgi:diguanylate cyclase (GGDEF)-like protein/PAS domain S-box-containing protein